MNIFVLDGDPKLAAAYLCNKHVVKMVTETAQLLATCYSPGTLRFKHTHVRHPCAIWARSSLGNFRWLLTHGLWIADEYAQRYGRIHGSTDVLEACAIIKPNVSEGPMTPFARAIKEPWRTQTINMSTIDAYRAYYVGDKARFARWAPRAQPPPWWHNVND